MSPVRSLVHAQSGRSFLLFLLVLVVYAGSLGNGFHFDDFHAVVHNPHIRSLSSIPSFFQDAGTFSVNPESAMYRPLLLTTFAVDRALFGPAALGHHVINVVLHGLAAVMVQSWLVALGLQARVAGVTALLFAVHPINSEAVCYISSRSELLMGLCMLTALSFYARSSGRRGRMAVSLLAATASFLAKSVGVIAPLAIILADIFSGGMRRVRQNWLAYSLFSIPVLMYLLAVRGAAAYAVLDSPVRPLGDQLWTQAKAQAYYLQLIALPAHLNVEHQFKVSASAEPVAVLAVMFLLSLAASIWIVRRQLRWLALAAGWWVLLLMPTTLVPLIVLVNEHRLYMAGLGVLLPVAVCLASLEKSCMLKRLRMATWALAGYTIVLALLTMQRTGDWADEVTLWRDSAAKSPQMLRPHLRLADGLKGAGDTRGAEASYLRAVALRPHHPGALNNLGLLYRELDRDDEGELQFRALLAVSADNVPARLNLAELLLQRGAWEAADAQYDTVLGYENTEGRAQIRRGQIALRYGTDTAVALKHFDNAIANGADGEAAAHVGRGIALRKLGDNDLARAAYLRAVGVAPERSDVWYNFGNLHVDRGNFAPAVDAYQRVIDIGDDAELARSAGLKIRDIRDHVAATIDSTKLK
jgi:tetratricopeptide (TPR) repeat protein